jgi:hypothetical protein
VRGENVFRLAETSELFGRGGPDDPDFILVPRRRHEAEQSASGQDDEVGRVPPTDRAAP